MENIFSKATSTRTSFDSSARPFNSTCSFAFEPLERWSKFHVADSLRALGQYAVGGQSSDTRSFEEYAENFLANNVDGMSLVNLTCVRLKNDLQVGNMDHRRKIFDWIEHLMVASGSDEAETPGPMHLQRQITHNSVISMEVEAQALQRMRAQQSRQLAELRGKTMTVRDEVNTLRAELLHGMSQNQQEFMGSVQLLSSQLAAVLQERNNMSILNRELYNQVQDLRGAIRVICRVRPVLASVDKGEDLEAGREPCVSIPDSSSILLNHQGYRGGNQASGSEQEQVCKLFKFDQVYGPHSTQAQVFESIEPLVRSVLDGYNVCIFAYGQTGSGKTHTMMGQGHEESVSRGEEDAQTTGGLEGINVRALDLLFKMRDERRKSNQGVYEIGMEMREIYNDNVRDLLVDHTAFEKGWGVRADPRKVGEKETTRVVRVESTPEVLQTIRCGERARATGATALNQQSSRSHCIVTVFAEGHLETTQTRFSGRLQLVDLAGSERVLRSEAEGARLKEAQHINRSLSALGDVISALQEKRSHVPFRNSVLTRHLQESLGGASKVLMFAHINPCASSAQESLSTLVFAQRVASVELGKARQNQSNLELLQAKEELPRVKEEVERAVRLVAVRDEEIDRLEGKLRRLEDSASRQNLSREQSSMELCSRLQKEAREADAARARAVHERDEAREHSYSLQQSLAQLNLELQARGGSTSAPLPVPGGGRSPSMSAYNSGCSTPANRGPSSALSTPMVKSAFSSTGSSPREHYASILPSTRTSISGAGTISRVRSSRDRNSTGNMGSTTGPTRGRTLGVPEHRGAQANKRRSSSASVKGTRTAVLSEIQEMPSHRRGISHASGYASDGATRGYRKSSRGGVLSSYTTIRNSFDRDAKSSGSSKRWM